MAIYHTKTQSEQSIGFVIYSLKSFKLSENELATLVVDKCFAIHKQYGPGLYESVYEEIFCYEWNITGIPYRRQVQVPIVHGELKIDAAFRLDVMIDELVIIEFKSVETLAPVHFKQVQTYLRLTELKLGLLINFNVDLIKNGIHRIVNRL